MSSRAEREPLGVGLSQEDEVSLARWLTLVDHREDPHSNQRRFLAEYLFNNPELYSGKTVVIMGCACGVLRRAMCAIGGKGGLKPHRVYVFDVLGSAACKCADRPACLRRFGLSPGTIDSPFSADLLGKLNNDVRKGGEKAQLIIFNHPLFFAECGHDEFAHGEDEGVCRNDKRAVLRALLLSAKSYLREPGESEHRPDALASHPSIVIPYFDLSGQHGQSDPGIEGPENGYWTFTFDNSLGTNGTSVTACASKTSCGAHKIYRLLCRPHYLCGFRSFGLHPGGLCDPLSNTDRLYEMIPWVKCLAESGSESADSPSAVVFRRFVASPLAQTCLDSACGDAGALVVYYNHATTMAMPRIGVKILDSNGRSADQDGTVPSWLRSFNDVFADPGYRKALKQFDLTEAILDDFRRLALSTADSLREDFWKSAASSQENAVSCVDSVELPKRPFYLVCQTHGREPEILDRPLDGINDLMRMYSGSVTVRFRVPGDFPDSEGIPSSGSWHSESLRKLFEGRGSDRRDGFVGFLNWYYAFFRKNSELKQHCIPDLNFVLLPLWVGTASDPIPLGSIILFTSGRPPRDFLNGVICTTIQYLQPIRTMQLQKQVATEAAIQSQVETHKASSHAIGTEIATIGAWLQGLRHHLRDSGKLPFSALERRVREVLLRNDALLRIDQGADCAVNVIADEPRRRSNTRTMSEICIDGAMLAVSAFFSRALTDAGSDVYALAADYYWPDPQTRVKVHGAWLNWTYALLAKGHEGCTRSDLSGLHAALQELDGSAPRILIESSLENILLVEKKETGYGFHILVCVFEEIFLNAFKYGGRDPSTNQVSIVVSAEFTGHVWRISIRNSRDPARWVRCSDDRTGEKFITKAFDKVLGVRDAAFSIGVIAESTAYEVRGELAIC